MLAWAICQRDRGARKKTGQKRKKTIARQWNRSTTFLPKQDTKEGKTRKKTSPCGVGKPRRSFRIRVVQKRTNLGGKGGGGGGRGGEDGNGGTGEKGGGMGGGGGGGGRGRFEGQSVRSGDGGGCRRGAHNNPMEKVQRLQTKKKTRKGL